MPSGILQPFFILFLTVKSFTACSQELPKSIYGLPLVNSISLYHQTLQNHREKEIIALSPRPGLFLDLRYAAKNNFMNSILYPESPRETYLRKPAALALDSVLQDLTAIGLGLRIFDAYRPYFVTVALWEKVHDSRYAADPVKGSGHNRGIAVDLTLVDLKTGKSLDMPTEFDNFTDSARQDFMALSPEIVRNRNLLEKVMENHGFIPLITEWWHFSWPYPENFEVLDLHFSEMKKIALKIVPAESAARAKENRPIP